MPSTRHSDRVRQARYKWLTEDAGETPEARKPGKAQQKKMDGVLKLIRQGMTNRQALATYGIKTRNTLDQWKRRYPGFAAEYQRANRSREGEFVPTPRPFDDNFREDYFGFSTPRHLKVIMDAITSLEAEAVAEEEPRILMVLVPPDFAKSTLTEDYLSHQLAVDPNLRCFFLSKTEGTAKKRVGRIMRRMTDEALCPKFIEDYGPFKADQRVDAKPWTQRAFIVFHQNSGERDFSLEALGIGGHIYNVRADRIVADDIADLGNQTPAEIEKQLTYLQLEVRSRLTEAGLMVIIGTYIAEAGLYQRLEELGFCDRIIKLPAIFSSDHTEVLSDGTEVSWKAGESLWPERHSIRKLEKLRDRTDKRIWELSYQQNPLPSVGAVFNQQMIEGCYNKDRYIGHVPEGCTLVAGVDPSVSNYTAGVVFAVSPKGIRYLVDVWNEKGLTGEGGDLQAGVVEFIVELCLRYRINTLAVENVSWAKLINNSFTLRKSLYDLGVRHLPVAIGPAGRSGEAEDHAIAQLSGLFTHRLIDIPAERGAIEHLAQFRHQFLTWSGGKQHWRKAFDILKAFRMAEHAAKELERNRQSPDATAEDPKRPNYMKGKVLRAVG